MTTIRIVNGSDVTTWTPTGDVTLAAGSHLAYGVDADARKARMSCDLADGWKEAFYEGTRDCIENMTDATLDNAGTPYYVDFRPSSQDEGHGYYLSTVNGESGILGAFDIAGGPNLRWGPRSFGISVNDMSRPDVDCLDYVRIAGYLTKINEVADRIIDQISGTPSSGATNPAIYGLWKQYQALREMWNYLVIRNMVVFGMEHQGNKLFVKARFSNPTSVTIPVGDLSVGFVPCSYNGLFHKCWSSDSQGNGLDWATSSSKYQNMSSGRWVLSPSSPCSVEGGGYIEVTAVFLVFGTTLATLSRKVSRDIAPWVDKLPGMANGKVTTAGWLSWERPHFNPTTYGSPVPSGLPPTGDGCTLKRSTGDVTAAWTTDGSLASTRPALHLDWICDADKSTASFSDFTATVTPGTVDPNGTFSLSGTGTTSTLSWTPAGGSPASVLTVSFSGSSRHFHKGDHISLDIPEGWTDPVNATLVKVSCIWDIPVNACIRDAAKAGGNRWMNISHDELYRKSVPARTGNNDYDVEQIRSIVLHGS